MMLLASGVPAFKLVLLLNKQDLHFDGAFPLTHCKLHFHM